LFSPYICVFPPSRMLQCEIDLEEIPCFIWLWHILLHEDVIIGKRDALGLLYYLISLAATISRS
jgi:hypothetical protein